LCVFLSVFFDFLILIADFEKLRDYGGRVSNLFVFNGPDIIVKKKQTKKELDCVIELFWFIGQFDPLLCKTSSETYFAYEKQFLGSILDSDNWDRCEFFWTLSLMLLYQNANMIFMQAT
jgi:hypothetical protein